jgi:hypothetical protein
MAGDHVPGIPFKEVVGNAGIEVPMQYGPTGEKTGVVSGIMIIKRLVEDAH